MMKKRRKNKEGRPLVVAIQGIRSAGQLTIGRLQRDRAFAGAKWVRYSYDYLSVVGLLFGAAEARSRDLRRFIDKLWVEGDTHSELILVGSDFGALLARRAYLLGLGADGADRPSLWSRHVSRIILIEPPDRGVRKLWGSTILSPLLPRDSRAGSEFVTNLRVSWASELFGVQPSETPVVVHVHEDIEEFNPTPSPRMLNVDMRPLTALADNTEDLIQTIARGVPRESPPAPVVAPAKVIFILHGIRANRLTWVNDATEMVKTRDPSSLVIANGYGWYSGLMFAVPSLRRKPLEWFWDQYALARANNPAAEFHFIGHSNGTYILGESLRRIRGMRFSRIALSGSVLPREYDWDARAAFQQVTSLRNDRANRDWPVAFLCSALRGLGMKDVGTGGFEGFGAVTLKGHHEVFWHDGGHSAAVDDQQSLESIVDFALTGDSKLPPLVSNVPAKFHAMSVRLPPVVAIAAITLLTWSVWVLWPALQSLQVAPSAPS